MSRLVLAGALLTACGGAQQPARPRCGADVDAVILDQADADALRGCAGLRSLHVRAGGPVDLAPLATLAEVGGALLVGPTLALTSVSLPALRAVGDLRLRGNLGLVGVYLLRLETAGSVLISDDPSLTTWSAPELHTISGAFTIERVPSLTLIDADRLVAVGGAVRIRPTAAALVLTGRFR